MTNKEQHTLLKIKSLLNHLRYFILEYNGSRKRINKADFHLVLGIWENYIYGEKK